MSALRSAVSIVAERVNGKRLAARLAARSSTQPIVRTPIAVYFADQPSGLHQLRRWYRVLEAVNAVHPTAIVTSVPATYRRVIEETTLTVAFAAGAPSLTTEFDRRGVRVVLYVNHNALNFRVLRFPAPVHVFIGHGESAKESSVSRQLKAYDFTFVGDAAYIEQLRGIRGYDADAAAVVAGAPWLDFLSLAPESWVPDGKTVVLYAPTWEGDRPSMGYGSVETLGEAIVAAILGDPRLRLIYRPHPWLGRVRGASLRADARIRSAMTAAGRGDVIDTGEYGWVLAAADVCVTDVGSVVADWQATGKPIIVTDVPRGVAEQSHALADETVPRVGPATASGIVAIIDDAVAAGGAPAVLGDGTQTSLFLAAIATMLEKADQPTF